MIKYANFGLSFLLEVMAVVVIGYWGFSLEVSKVTCFIAGIGLPLVFILIWGRFCAPASPHRLSGLWLICLKLLMFALAAWSLFLTDGFLLAILFFVLVILNIGMSIRFKTL
ncbi:YrdB family protein [Lactococcus piscium]|uniref:YrdB family protein n=1 Tax=Pseudolactococcus carnosus TaxID=2749961 RepID=UPI003852F7E7|nr:YrdB family protein [Lactococcus carnosus]